MSHHFDTVLAKQDPRLNVADMYLFDGADDSTVFVLTTNADSGLSAPDTLHEEGIYSFRIHGDRNDAERMAFKLRFGTPSHRDDDEDVHVQPYQLIQSNATQSEELSGQIILEGKTGEIEEMDGIRAFVGTVHEMWAANAFAFGDFLHALWAENHFDLSIWAADPQDFFNHRNATGIVLQVPNKILGRGKIHVWANITLFGHAAESQVSRWGMPIFSHLFLSEPGTDALEQFHKHHPSDDVALFAPHAIRLTSRMSGAAGRTSDPEGYAKRIVDRLCPTMLPYEVGTKASFTAERFNGRPLADDVLDVMFTLAANTPVADHVAPNARRIVETFPYYGPPYSKEEQKGLTGIPQHDRSA